MGGWVCDQWVEACVISGWMGGSIRAGYVISGWMGGSTEDLNIRVKQDPYGGKAER